MLKKFFLLLCGILIYFSSYARYEFLLHKTYAERYKQIDSCFYYNKPLRTDKPAFFREIKLLEKEAENAGDVELQAEAKLLSIAFNSASKQGEYAKVEKEAISLLKFAQKNELIQIEIRCRQFIGRFYMEKVGRYVEAIDEFLTSYYLIHKLSADEFPTMKEHLYEVAHAYYNFGDYASAKKYMMEAQLVSMPGNTRMQDDKNKIRTYINLENTLGLLYRNEKQYDSAIYYFRQVYSLAEAQNDTVWMGIALGNIGIGYYHLKQYDKAIPLLQQDIFYSLKYGEVSNGVNTLIKLCDIYVQQNNMPVVKQLMDSARRLITPASILEPSQHLQHLYLIMAKYHHALGNASLAYKYMDSARVAKELMDNKKNAITLLNEQHKLELQIHRAELQKAESDKHIMLLRRNALIGVIILLAILIIVFINGRRKYYMQKSRYAEAEKNKAELQLDDFRQRIQEKNQLIENITAEIDKYKEQNGTAPALDYNLLKELEQAILLTDEQWDSFKNTFDKVHIGYTSRLKNKMPDISPAETRFVLLSKMKLSNKEMAGMLGVTAQAMRANKYRLMKKLGIEDDEVLDNLIQSI